MQNKTPSTSHDMLGTQFWRRPTLARPIAVLPSGLQRFTAVFGMGTGGATALLSPEICSDSFRSRFLARDSRFVIQCEPHWHFLPDYDSQFNDSRFTLSKN